MSVPIRESFSFIVASSPASFNINRFTCFSAPCLPESRSRLLCFSSCSDSLSSLSSPSRDSTFTASSRDFASRANFSSCRSVTLLVSEAFAEERVSLSSLCAASRALFSLSWPSLTPATSDRSSCLQPVSRPCLSVSNLESCSFLAACSAPRSSLAWERSARSSALAASSALSLVSRSILAALTSLRRCDR